MAARASATTKTPKVASARKEESLREASALLHQRDGRAHAALPIQHKQFILWWFMLQNGPDRIRNAGVPSEFREPPLQVSPRVLQKRLEFPLKQ